MEIIKQSTVPDFISIFGTNVPSEAALKGKLRQNDLLHRQHVAFCVFAAKSRALLLLLPQRASHRFPQTFDPTDMIVLQNEQEKFEFSPRTCPGSATCAHLLGVWDCLCVHPVNADVCKCNLTAPKYVKSGNFSSSAVRSWCDRLWHNVKRKTE